MSVTFDLTTCRIGERATVNPARREALAPEEHRAIASSSTHRRTKPAAYLQTKPVIASHCETKRSFCM
jgi:hypothetical protein